MTPTIHTDSEILAQLKIYCAIKKIHLQDIVRTLAKRDSDFQKVITQMKKLDIDK